MRSGSTRLTLKVGDGIAIVFHLLHGNKPFFADVLFEGTWEGRMALPWIARCASCLTASGLLINPDAASGLPKTAAPKTRASARIVSGAGYPLLRTRPAYQPTEHYSWV